MWMHIFILLGNTDILSYGSTKSDDIDLWLIFFQQGGPFSIFKGCKIEGQHESHPILSPDISNWRFCQDKSTHKFFGDNFDFFKVKSKVKGQQDLQLDLCDLLTLKKVNIFWFYGISLFS